MARLAVTVHELMHVFEANARHGLASSHSFGSVAPWRSVSVGLPGTRIIVPSLISTRETPTPAATSALTALVTSVCLKLNEPRDIEAHDTGCVLDCSVDCSLVGKSQEKTGT